MRTPILGTALLCATLVAPALAQTPQTMRLAGVIESVDGLNLVVKTAAAERKVVLAPNATVFALIKANLSDIKPGVFVGVGATPQADGSQQAIRVVIFPEAMRGLGEGHRPWDRPGTTMTNATVDTSVTSVEGQVLNVKYKGGEKKIIVGPNAAILTFVNSDKSELKPGANVQLGGPVNAAGAIEAERVTVERGVHM
jgi:hypothetical protein